jgi:hypothetical protein
LFLGGTVLVLGILLLLFQDKGPKLPTAQEKAQQVKAQQKLEQAQKRKKISRLYGDTEERVAEDVRKSNYSKAIGRWEMLLRNLEVHLPESQGTMDRARRELEKVEDVREAKAGEYFRKQKGLADRSVDSKNFEAARNHWRVFPEEFKVRGYRARIEAELGQIDQAQRDYRAAQEREEQIRRDEQIRRGEQAQSHGSQGMPIPDASWKVLLDGQGFEGWSASGARKVWRLTQDGSLAGRNSSQEISSIETPVQFQQGYVAFEMALVSGALYFNKARSFEVSFEADGKMIRERVWHKMVISIRKGQLRVWLDGRKIYDTPLQEGRDLNSAFGFSLKPGQSAAVRKLMVKSLD